MRRRIVPAALAVLALGVIALLRRRGRAARAVSTPSPAAIPQRIADRPALPQPQVDPEPSPVMEPSAPVMETTPARDADAPASLGEAVPDEAAKTARFLSIPWSTHPDPPPPSATELQIHCTLTAATMELARVDVRETASQVFVTVLARWRPAGERDAAGTPDLKRTATAALRAPLGDRALVHAPHDDAPR